MLMGLALHRSFPQRGGGEGGWGLEETHVHVLSYMLSAEALSQASWSAEKLPRVHQTKTLSVGSVAHS